MLNIHNFNRVSCISRLTVQVDNAKLFTAAFNVNDLTWSCSQKSRLNDQGIFRDLAQCNILEGAACIRALSHSNTPRPVAAINWERIEKSTGHLHSLAQER